MSKIVIHYGKLGRIKTHQIFISNKVIEKEHNSNLCSITLCTYTNSNSPVLFIKETYCTEMHKIIWHINASLFSVYNWGMKILWKELKHS